MTHGEYLKEIVSETISGSPDAVARGYVFLDEDGGGPFCSVFHAGKDIDHTVLSLAEQKAYCFVGVFLVFDTHSNVGRHSRILCEVHPLIFEPGIDNLLAEASRRYLAAHTKDGQVLLEARFSDELATKVVQ